MQVLGRYQLLRILQMFDEELQYQTLLPATQLGSLFLWQQSHLGSLTCPLPPLQKQRHDDTGVDNGDDFEKGAVSHAFVAQTLHRHDKQPHDAQQ
ncbi:MAG: hypothetical protein ACFNTM_02410, partial [Cardiobacterium sp.]